MSAPTAQPATSSAPPPPGRRARRLVVVAVALVLAVAAALLAYVLTRPERVEPEAFGAVGDGVADDTAALQEALDALEPGQRLVLADDAVYATSDVITLSVDDVEVVGGAELRATDEERSSFQVEADDVLVSGVTFTTPGTTQRWSAEDQQRLLLRGTDGVELRDVTVRGSAAAGVFVAGASTNFLLDGVQVEDTRADGIHVTQGSSDGRLVDVSTSRTGDDGVAVVSYSQDGAPSARIEVERPVVRESDARGISVVGGEDITWTDVDVAQTAAAGIYVATEGDPYFTTSTSGVLVDGAVVVDANIDEGIDHGAVLLFDGNDDSSLSDVAVVDVDITGTRQTASRQVGVIGGQDVDGVRLERFSLVGGPAALLSAPAAGADLVVEGWTSDGEEVDPLAAG
ncbi:glycosyl hydrolase family 28-related protein [Pseudokineococcus sp. 1T1Z-3]|uniref:glycosyl hydrolase family 28-related protein n=1 Tax=Pseudokineococcus sp. 1T1Z-3 TaxID=3132745 RepID=UPI003098AA3D